MKNIVFISLTTLVIFGNPGWASKCGCKTLSQCYIDMLDAIHSHDEAYCVEDAAIGTATLTVFLRALELYCGNVLRLNSQFFTYDMRALYEVILFDSNVEDEAANNVPIIVIDAGQEAGTESVRLALYIIEQLVGCQENKDMIQKVKWVILPSTNPDGMEYSRYKKKFWRKNLRLSEDDLSFGVDISRNFDENWGSCRSVKSSSSIYQGPSPASENETISIKTALNKFKTNTKIYISLKRDGHSIGYPPAYSRNSANNADKLKRVAAEVASKVNLRSSGVHLFGNDTIRYLEGKDHCGHSVDYAHSIGIPLTFEMRVVPGIENRITSKFQTLPRGYESSLRNGYFSGIRELYNVLTNEKRYADIFH